ncbi:MAG: hypothetical protein WBC20_01235 [Candidatus Aminicenantaceae bacterium]
MKKAGFLFIVTCTIIFFKLGMSLQHQRQVNQQTEVENILKASVDYCHKLENAALYFVCMEEITEKINFSKDIAWDSLTIPREVWIRRKRTVAKRKNTYLYDFQFIRKNNRVRETRTLLEENGKKKREKNAKLKTMSFLFKNALLGPVGILAAHWQPFYDYRISGEDEVNGLPVVILEVTPKAGHKIDFLFGKVWLNNSNFDILKIEWSQWRIGNFHIFENRGLKYKSEPRISLISEFNIEKNGIRFPSKFFIEEAYIDKKGKKFVRSETTVIYRDFKFFTVEVEIK